MSNHLISMVYKKDLRTPMRKSVMALLADKASDGGGGIYASKQTIADELCCSRQAIIDTIKQFVADGLLIEVGKRPSPNGFTIEYAIDVHELSDLPWVKSHDPSIKLTRQPAVPVNVTQETRQPAGHEPLEPITPISSNEDIPPTEKPIRVKPEHLLEAWNAMAGRAGLSKAKSFDHTRRRKTLTLIKTRSTDDITEAIAAVERSPFCRGENDRGWRADFDFILQPKSFNRLIEGFYG